jgi:magnesium transporter
MINCIRYDKRGVKRVSIDNLSLGKGRIWVDVNNPDDKELKKIGKVLGVYSRNLEDSLDIKEVPRAVVRKNYCFIVLRAPNKEKRSISIGIFVGRNYILTVHPKAIRSLSKFFKVCSTKEGDEFFGRGVSYVFYRIISEFTREFNSEIEKMSDKLDVIENKILKNKVEDIGELFTIKKHFMFIRRAIKSNMVVIKKLEDGGFKFIEGKEFMGDLFIEGTQLEHMADVYDEKLTNIFDMYMSSVSNKLNDIMKSFTVIASLLLLPMLVAGIWGMNFANIPFYNDKYGFYTPILFMVISMIIMLIFFKFKRWV